MFPKQVGTRRLHCSSNKVSSTRGSFLVRATTDSPPVQQSQDKSSTNILEATDTEDSAVNSTNGAQPLNSHATKDLTAQLPDCTDNHNSDKASVEIPSTSGVAHVVTPLDQPSPQQGTETPAALPLLLILPGIDGSSATAARIAPSLATKFDVKALVIPKDSRQDFAALVHVVKEYLEQDAAQQAEPPGRPVYLLGISFGGVLALAVAAEASPLVDRIILVNPATNFSVSAWPLAGQLLQLVDDNVYNNVLPYAMLPTFFNPLQMVLNQMRRGAFDLGPVQEVMQNIAEKLPLVLPKATLDFRLGILQQGVEYLETRWMKIDHRVLAILSANDSALPSSTEGSFLQSNLKRCRSRVVQGHGHDILREGFDLLGVLEEEGFCSATRNLTSWGKNPKGRVSATIGQAGPMEVPTPQDLQNDKELLFYDAIFDTQYNPCFFSTLSDGTVVEGFDGIPKGGPILLVGNHQASATDVVLIVPSILEGTGRLVRGLTHPLSMRQFDRMMRDPNEGADLEGLELMREMTLRRLGAGSWRNLQRSGITLTYGGVKVTPKNMVRLLEAGEAVMVFPGGLREATKDSRDRYRLFWPERSEFVRLAARYNATIIPFAGVGAEDNFETLVPIQDILKTLQQNPLTKPLADNYLNSIPSARIGAIEVPLDDRGLPVDLPGTGLYVNTGLPKRQLYLFGKPIPLTREMAGDKEACQKVYSDVKAGVEGNIQYLLRRRVEDPYQDMLPRLLYGALTGKQAPSFTP